jgi:UDP-N-acetylmuramoyl-tripeptide--D-alanyl-D-alanine ligase
MLPNHAKFNYLELKVLFGEANLINISEEIEISGITTDSRQVKSGNVFVALIGERFDGHDKAAEAIESDAAAAVVNRSWYEVNTDAQLPLIVVEDTLSALGVLANHHRRRFSYPLVAIGGSNGKTTTKEILAHILEEDYSVLKTFQNFNNQIGVPLMLLQMTEDHQIAVLEIGTNQPGEIALLSEMVQPTHGLITNIGKEHLEQLIDLDGVEFEETFLFGYLHKYGGSAIINNDDERLKKYTMLLDDKLTYGEEGELSAEILLDEELLPKIKMNYKEESQDAEMISHGLAIAYNGLAAAAAAVKLGLPLTKIADRLSTYMQDDSKDYARMTVEKINDISILNDCYNANPDSMKMSLRNLEMMNSKGRRIAVMGDMLEMGETAEQEHIEVLKYAIEFCDKILIFGDTFQKAAEAVESEKYSHYESKELLFDELNEQIAANDVILVKGSRGMRLEEIIIKLRETNV